MKLTKYEYMAALLTVYRTANNADQPDAQTWQKPEHASDHCRAIEAILKSLVTAEQWEAFCSTWEIESLIEEDTNND